MLYSSKPLPDSQINRDLEKLRIMLPFIDVTVSDESMMYTVYAKDIYELAADINKLIGSQGLKNIVAIPMKSYFSRAHNIEVRKSKSENI